MVVYKDNVPKRIVILERSNVKMVSNNQTASFLKIKIIGTLLECYRILVSIQKKLEVRKNGEYQQV